MNCILEAHISVINFHWTPGNQHNWSLLRCHIHQACLDQMNSNKHATVIDNFFPCFQIM